MDADTRKLPLIRTKLYAPSVPLDHVQRDRLLALLDKALDVPLTLVSAPAGYGKSVLVSNWIGIRERPVAWLSLDDADSDLRQFLLYLLAALDATFVDSRSEIKDLLTAHDLAPVPVLACHLLNHLDAMPDPCVIVLDDYHHLERGSAVHELLEILLQHPPPNAHLIILTRRDPPLSLLALRAGTRMVEIRLPELRFTAAETAQMLVATAGVTVNEAARANLQRELEGWAAGLRLVMLAIRKSADPEAFLIGLHGGIPQTQEYLLNEVLAGLSPDNRTVLLKSSILDRYCADLIDAVCVEDDQTAPSKRVGHVFVKFLEQSNLFSFSLDAHGKWYRYHHLFQALLQRQLQRSVESDEVARLHLRASGWLETNGDISEAVQHALAGGDEDLAADIVERHRRAALEEDRWIAVRRWLDQLPSDLAQRRPALLMTRAWISYYELNLAEMASCVEKFAAIFDDTSADPLLSAELSFFQGLLAYWSGDADRARDRGEQALGVFPKNPGMMAGESIVYAALSRQMSGDSNAAVKLLQEEKKAPRSNMGDMYLTRLFAAETFFNTIAARLPDARRAAENLDIVARRNDSVYAQVWGNFQLALNDFRSNRLEESQRTYAAAAVRRNVFERRAAVDCLTGMALASAMLQRPEDAFSALRELDEFSQMLREAEFLLDAESGHARVALLLEASGSALAWARSASPEVDPPGLFVWLDDPWVTQARVLIVAGDAAERQVALERLDDLRQQLGTLHNICQIIEVDVLRSLALAKLGQMDAARDALRATVALAAPGDVARPFVELGQPMAELLADLDLEGGEKAFVQRVLGYVAGVDAPGISHKSGSPAVSGVSTPEPNTVGVGDLTNRELDILDLLSQRLQNKEIAAKLFISTHTVNYHLKHIYQKLGVSSRRHAVTKAVNAGIVTAQ